MPLKYITFILLVFIIYSCSVNKEASNVTPVKELSEIQVRTIQEYLLDYKSKMLYQNYKEAKSDLFKALKVDSTHPVVCYELAKLFTLQDNGDSALIYINRSIQRESLNTEYRKLEVTINQLFSSKEITNVLIDKLLEDFPDDDSFWFIASDFYLKSKQFEKAYEVFDRYEKLKGFNEEIVINKYQILIELKKFKELEEILINYSKNYPNNQIVLQLYGDFYLQQNNIEKGIQIYQQLLTIYPENTRALYALAEYYRVNLQLNKSFEYIQKMIDIKDLDVNAKVEILLNFLSIASNDPKLEYYFGVLVRNLKAQYSNNADVQILNANLLIQNRQFTEAQKELELALRQKPDNLQGWIKLLMVDNELGLHDKIIEHAGEALEFFPNQNELYYYRGISFFLRNNFESSIQDLNFGNRITGKNDPLKFQFLYFLGEAYYKNDQIDKAFDLFDQALEINNQEISLLNNYAYYLSLLDQDLDKAKNMSLQTVKLEPNNSTYLDTYAWILFRLKDYKTALTYIEKAILNGGSSSGVIMEHYGDILYKNNKITEALSAWNEALKIGDHSEFLQQKIENKTYVE